MTEPATRADGPRPARRQRRTVRVMTVGLAVTGLTMTGLLAWPLLFHDGGDGTFRDPARAPLGRASGGSVAEHDPRAPLEPNLRLPLADVDLDMAGWYSWAVLDQGTDQVHGPANLAETSPTASMIKVWIAADYLHRRDGGVDDTDPTLLDQLSVMIRDSDNATASALYDELGRAESTDRMTEVCELSDSVPHDNWSLVRMSPRDTALLGACLADGRAAGDEWADWLLHEMRRVRGDGDFGIRDAFPAGDRERVAIKNGWVDRVNEQEFHVNCMAVGDGWTMGVMVRYPIEVDYGYGGYGADICQQVAARIRDSLPVT